MRCGLDPRQMFGWSETRIICASSKNTLDSHLQYKYHVKQQRRSWLDAQLHHENICVSVFLCLSDCVCLIVCLIVVWWCVCVCVCVLHVLCILWRVLSVLCGVCTVCVVCVVCVWVCAWCVCVACGVHRVLCGVCTVCVCSHNMNGHLTWTKW